MKKPRTLFEMKEYAKSFHEASTNHSRLMGKPNDGMADLLMAIDDDIDKLSNNMLKRSFSKKMSEIDKAWDKLWNEIVDLSKNVTKAK